MVGKPLLELRVSTPKRIRIFGQPIFLGAPFALQLTTEFSANTLPFAHAWVWRERDVTNLANRGLILLHLESAKFKTFWRN
jgi:hypothetical protein